MRDFDKVVAEVADFLRSMRHGRRLDLAERSATSLVWLTNPLAVPPQHFAPICSAPRFVHAKFHLLLFRFPYHIALQHVGQVASRTKDAELANRSPLKNQFFQHYGRDLRSSTVVHRADFQTPVRVVLRQTGHCSLGSGLLLENSQRPSQHGRRVSASPQLKLRVGAFLLNPSEICYH